MIRIIVKREDLPRVTPSSGQYMPYSTSLPRFADEVVIVDGDGREIYYKSHRGGADQGDEAEAPIEGTVLIDYDVKNKELTPRTEPTDALDLYKLERMRRLFKHGGGKR